MDLCPIGKYYAFTVWALAIVVVTSTKLRRIEFSTRDNFQKKTDNILIDDINLKQQLTEWHRTLLFFYSKLN